MKIPAGRINKLFGTEGGVMLSLYTAFPDDFNPVRTPLFVTIDGLEVPLWCSRFERRGQAGATAAFDDLDTDRRATELLGLEFRIERADESEDDEFYLEDLIGFAAEAEEIASEADREENTAQTTFSGTIVDYYDSEANPLFELESDGRRILIPAAEELIARINFEARRIRFVVPRGLLTLE